MEQLRRISLLVIILSGLILMTGCGNKGDLYIPEPPAEAQTTDSGSE